LWAQTREKKRAPAKGLMGGPKWQPKGGVLPHCGKKMGQEIPFFPQKILP